MPVVSVAHDPSVTYPPHDRHAPAIAYPERPFADETLGENRAYDLVRQCLIGAGADSGAFGTASWNPLKGWIDRGSPVFILPNLVVERRPSEPLADFQGKCTDGAVLRAVADYAILAAGDASLVGFGNASLQSCDYAQVAGQTGMADVGRFYRERTGRDLGPRDLRAVVTRWQHGALLDRREQNLDDIVNVDLGSDSLLDEFYTDGYAPEFRVSDYDHRDISDYHGPGRHVYAVHRSLLDARTIISVPKLKTHEKVGITCAVKGTVGAIARKECLAHHRKGGSEHRGDEYPHATFIRDLASSVADRVSILGMGVGANAIRVAGKGLYRLLRSGRQGIMAGAWHGNDTAWRMAVDIARILRFAGPDGRMSDTPQRRHVAFIDGVVGGESEGPVYPRGHRAGVVLFGSDPVWADHAAALLMKFDPNRIPIIARSSQPMRYPITDATAESVRVACNGAGSDLESLTAVLDRGFDPPKGWSGWIERPPQRLQGMERTPAAPVGPAA